MSTAGDMVDGAAAAPPIWVASRRFGGASEPWLWRQTVGFTRVRPHVVCWERQRAADYPTGGLDLSVVPFAAAPAEGRGRHLHRLRNLPGGNFYASAGRERAWLLDLARRTGARAILCHFGYMSLRMLPVAEAAGAALVAHFHGLDVSSGLRNRWYRWSLARCMERFAAVVVVGSHQRRWMLDQGVPEEKVHLIPCGVPTAEFSPGPEREGGGARFICVSRLTEFKGVDYSIRAFAQAVGSVAGEASLTVVGDGPQRDALAALAQELGVGGRVRFTGAIPVAEVRELMRASDVFLQHSLEGRDGWVEGFGVSIAEASACGLPVVVTDCGGITDQVIDAQTGFVTAQRDTSAMAEAMVALARDPDLRRRLGRAGRERVSSCFDTRMQVRKLEDVVLGCLGGGAAAARGEASADA